jgi:hypothetical protein
MSDQRIFDEMFNIILIHNMQFHFILTFRHFSHTHRFPSQHGQSIVIGLFGIRNGIRVFGSRSK